MLCQLCPRDCKALRTESQNIGGFCKMPLKPVLARAGLHFWEEPCISGKNGSGTVFFSGCSLGCVYCQNTEISQNNNGKAVSVQRLAEIFMELEEKGAHNINLVTPTHYVSTIIEALEIYKPKIPIVYNSSGFECVESLKMLEGYVDIYLMDFKYLSADRAQQFSLAPQYPDVCKPAILEAYHQQPQCVFEDGILKRGLIVRHLLLPAATNEAIAIFDWVRNNTPNAYFSLMGQYIPFGKAKTIKPIDRKITKREYEKVADYIIESGFENCYLQQLSSAKEEYIPQFDFSGI